MCFWDGHTAWIQVALQPMHASVWDRRNVEYLDLGGEGYSFRKTTAPGVCDITYVHKSKGGSPYDGEVVRVTSTVGSRESCSHDDNDPTRRFLRALIQRLPPPG